MKLYVIEFAVFGQSRFPTIIAKVPVTITGLSPFSEEGTWSIPESDLKYFGYASGGWVTESENGEKLIRLRDDTEPNIISIWWRDVPFSVATLEGVLKLPLSLGETGTGDIIPFWKKFYYPFGWKVIERGF